jgi:hypothetical protein
MDEHGMTVTDWWSDLSAGCLQPIRAMIVNSSTHWFSSVVAFTISIINGHGMGCAYYFARGEILRPRWDDQKQRRLAITYLPIKNESMGNEDDQIPL